MAPGGPSVLIDPALTPEQVAALSERLGLDEPIPVRYIDWLQSIVTGDMGSSLRNQRPVTELILDRAPATFVLAMSALALTLLVGIPLGVVAALRPNSRLDQTVSGFTAFGVSVPTFWLAIMLVLVFSVSLRWLPASGIGPGVGGPVVDLLRHLVLPTIVLGMFGVAEVTRYTRSSVMAVLGADYVRSARGKGVAEPKVIGVHVMRNALLPIITVIGLLIPRLLGGAPITEAVFAWPGLGRLAVDAAFQRDYPVVMGVTIVVSFSVIVASFIVDVLYPVIDPRVVRS